MHNGNTFEEEVRNIARQLWSTTPGQGSREIDGRERDGFFDSGEVKYVVEATTERTKSKIEYDGKKTHDLVNKLRKEGHLALGIIITRDEPTPDQKKVVEEKFKKSCQIISFSEFRKKLFDGLEYINLREKRPFGSIYDYASESIMVPNDDYIEQKILDEKTGTIYLSRSFIENMKNGNRALFLAEYGIGKSMFFRQIFYALSTRYRNKITSSVPVYINLREHLGQSDHIELLERHARNVGFSKPSSLVSAWAAGYVDLVIDGFDELATRGWTGDAGKLRESRRNAHSVVRKLIRETPSSSSIIICGRSGYFESTEEMRNSLGATGNLFNLYKIQDFDESQVVQYLKKKGIQNLLPAWVPSRPLLLGYLVSKGLISEICSIVQTDEDTKGRAWCELLNMICDRESRQLEGTDACLLLKFFSRLATIARSTATGMGSFSPTDLERIFYDITEKTALDDDRNVLMRLPGLGLSPESERLRSFIDQDFVEAASAMDEFEFIAAPFDREASQEQYGQIQHCFKSVGIDVLSYRIKDKFPKLGLPKRATELAIENDLSVLAFDCFNALARMEPFDRFLRFSSIQISEIDLSEEIFMNARVDFESCIIDYVYVPVGEDFVADVYFTECLIGTIEGRVSNKDLPEDHFIECEIDTFVDQVGRNRDVLQTSLPVGIKALVIALRKLWKQAGAGRLETAFFRGLDGHTKGVTPEVLRALLRHQMISYGTSRGKKIVYPTKSTRKIALEIIQSPNTAKYEIISEVQRL